VADFKRNKRPTSFGLHGQLHRNPQEQEAAKEQAAKNDPLAVLQREKDLLETELAIKIAKEALKQLAQ
jgi:hypothetical protein